MGFSRLSGVAGYAKREGKTIYVRGTIYRDDWPANPLSPNEALELASHLTTLANEANKPEFEPGQAYQDADGDVFMRAVDNDGWYDEHGSFYRDGFATRPIVRLVPESEVN